MQQPHVCIYIYIHTQNPPPLAPANPELHVAVWPRGGGPQREKERERERERARERDSPHERKKEKKGREGERSVYIYIYTHIHTHMYNMYIYTHTCIHMRATERVGNKCEFLKRAAPMGPHGLMGTIQPSTPRSHALSPHTEHQNSDQQKQKAQSLCLVGLLLRNLKSRFHTGYTYIYIYIYKFMSFPNIVA